MDEINIKIAALRQQFPDTESQEVLSDWEKNAKIAVMTANLQENDAIKIIIKNYQAELQTLNSMLLNDDSLFKSSDGMLLGQTIHARRIWCQRFLSIFTAAEAQVNNAPQALDTLANNATNNQ